MPYSVPTPPPTSLSTTPADSPPAPMRSLSTQAVPSYSFSNDKGPGAFASLGSLPRRGHAPSLVGNPRATSATAKRFHIKSSSEDSSSSSSDDDDLPLPVRRPTPMLAKKVYNDGDNDDAPLPPLKLRINRLGSPSFNGIPFPRSSPLSSPLPGASSPLPSPNRIPSGLLSPLSESNSSISNMAGLPASPSTELPISASNPIYSPYRYSPQDGTALPLPLRPSPPRSTSSPHLSNGRPLKSSLKSSSSASSLHLHAHHTRHMHTAHQRASSAPSTPGYDLASEEHSPASPVSSSASGSGANSPTTPKSVHFPSLPTYLERVRVFHKSEKPASLLEGRTQGEETETETETDRGSDWGGYGYRGESTTRVSTGSFPFPKIPSSPLSRNSNSVWPPTPPATSEYKKGLIKLELDMTGYPVPNPTSIPPNSDVHILLESISLSSPAPEDKIHLQGSFIVRNLAFQKDVCVRFTMDEWSTVSEIKANWAANFPSPFLTQRSSIKDVDTWDRFSFSINLSDYTVPSLPSKVIYFVGRYTVPGGEFWDNCNGRNWRVGFKVAKVEAENSAVKAVDSVPKTLPVSSPTVSAPTTSLASATASSNPSTATAPAPSVSLGPTTVVTPPSPRRHEALAQATAQRLRRFSLSNYVAPSSFVPPAASNKTEDKTEEQQSTANPETTKEESLSSSSAAQAKDTTTDKAKPSPKEREPLSIVTTPSSAIHSPVVSPPSKAPSPPWSSSSLNVPTPPTEVSSESLYDWFLQQWCFAGPSAMPDQNWRRSEHGHDISGGGTMGLEIEG